MMDASVASSRKSAPGGRMAPARHRPVIARFLAILSLVLTLLALPDAGARAETGYLAPADLDLTALLALPPAVGGDIEKAELRTLLDIQSTRTDVSAEAARADSTRSVFRFAGVFGNGFTEQALPETKALFRQVAKDTEEITDAAKMVFQRTRPFVTEPALAPLLVTPADGSRPTGRTPSYPSGHSAYAAVTSILLANAVPERKADIFARGREFAHNRLVAGVHYPSDVEAGWISGTVIANRLLHDARFQEDFRKVRAEIRHALALP